MFSFFTKGLPSRGRGLRTFEPVMMSRKWVSWCPASSVSLAMMPLINEVMERPDSDRLDNNAPATRTKSSQLTPKERRLAISLPSPPQRKSMLRIPNFPNVCSSPVSGRAKCSPTAGAKELKNFELSRHLTPSVNARQRLGSRRTKEPSSATVKPGWFL